MYSIFSRIPASRTMAIGKADCCGKTVDTTLSSRLYPSCTLFRATPRHCTVCCDQRKINTQSIVKRRHEFLQEHFYNLYKSRDDQNEHNGVQIFKIKRLQDKLMQNAPATQRCQGDNEDNSSHPYRRQSQSSWIHQGKEQIPRNWLSTTLLTSAEPTAINTNYFRLKPTSYASSPSCSGSKNLFLIGCCTDIRRM